ncbi:MAG: acylphosphatase [Verrucomicrobiae bacterium]|nr:acylphosphatase [Verrucomicrobiae bacterium]
MPTNTERAIVHFSGHVQGVGFRYTCRQLVNEFMLTGYVKNLEDGRVELGLEGEKPEIDGYLEELEKSGLKSFIRQRTIDWQPATGEWHHFRIVH